MSYQDRADARKEFMIHKTLKCDFIVKYEGHFTDKNFICILLEYMDNGDLGQYLKRQSNSYLPENKVWWFFIQTWLGIQYLHARKILHRDLKTINLFLSKDDKLKIGDLGVAKEVKESHTHTIVGTPYYLSPELWEEKPYNNKSDIWSLGCILYELWTLKHPFDAKTQGGLFLKIINEGYEPIPKFYSQELGELISWCLQKNWKDRPSIQQILENDKVMDEAIQLGLMIPTEDEMRDHINSQKTDFMTTFAKKKAGVGEAPAKRQVGGIGLMSKDKLSKKHVFDPKAKVEKPVAVPSRLGGAKYKAHSNSGENGLEKLTSDIADQVDNMLNPDSSKHSEKSDSSKASGAASNSESKPKRNAVPSIYQKQKKPTTNAVADKNVEKKVDKPEIKPKPKVESKVIPDRDYKKPWQRPATAGQKPEVSRKQTLEDNKKDTLRKKADNIAAKRKQFRPALIKKSSEKVTKDEKKNSITEQQDFEADDLEDEMLEMKAKAPTPVKQVKRPTTAHEPRSGIRKLNSQDPEKLKIPLNLIKDDEEEEFVGYTQDPKVINAYLHSEKPASNKNQKKEVSEGAGNKRASKLIGDIKKKMKDKSNTKASTGLTDECTGMTLETRASEENTYNPAATGHQEGKEYEHEEEKIAEFNNSSNNSKGSSNNSANLLDFEDDQDEKEIDLAFNYADNNFDDEDYEPGLTPHAKALMEEITEEEEGYEKKQIKMRIHEIEAEIQQRWETLSKLKDKETAEKWYEFFKQNIEDIDAVDNSEKMEQVHKFIKKQNVVNYKQMGFECFKLLSSHTDLENAKEDLADLEEEDE